MVTNGEESAAVGPVMSHDFVESMSHDFVDRFGVVGFGMAKSLPPGIRRQTIAFDPAVSGAVSVSEFCRRLGITRTTLYNIKARYRAQGNAALHAHSRAPRHPVRVYGDDTVDVIITIRGRLIDGARGATYAARSIVAPRVANA